MEVSPFIQFSVDAPTDSLNPWARIKHAGKALQVQVNQYDMAARKAPDGLTLDSSTHLKQLTPSELKVIAQLPSPEMTTLDQTASVAATQNPLIQFGRQVDKCDQAAKENKENLNIEWQHTEPSFITKAWGSFKTNALRTAGGLFGNRCYQLPTPGLISDIGVTLNKFTDGAENYFNLLGIGNKTFSIGPNRPYETYAQFFLTREGRQEWKQAVRTNFQDFLKPERFKGLTFSSFIKNTFLKRNARSLTQDVANGNICSGLLRSLGVATAGWNVISNTCQAYHYAKSKEDGSLGSQINTVCYTIAHAIGQTLKTALCWEAATIGLTIGTALCPVGHAAIVSGLIGGSIMSALTYKGLSRIIPDPPKITST